MVTAIGDYVVMGDIDMKSKRYTWLLSVLLLPLGCTGLSAYNPDGETDTDTDTDTDSDTDTDTDSDTDTDTDTDVDTDTDTDPIDITNVNPSYGTSAGGTSVTISGGPFDNSARVFFGGAEANIVNTNTNSLEVNTPAGAEGTVDIEISTDSGSGQMSNAFDYWLDGTGLTGVVGHFSWYHMVGNYWSSAPQDFGAANLILVEPTNFEYWEFYAPSLDTCVSEYETTKYVGAYEPSYSTINVRAPDSSSFSLPRDSATPYLYTTSDTNVYNYFIQNGTYTMETSQTGAWPEMEVTGVLKTPNAFSVTEPTINSDAPPTIFQYLFDLNWNGSGGDFILVILNRYSGSTVAEQVTCALRDDGQFTIPPTVWSSWTSDSQMDVLIGRGKTGTGVLPTSNADTRAVGIYWVYGAGFTF